MTLDVRDRAGLLIVGFLATWVALHLMLSMFFVVLSEWNIVWWGLLMLVSSVFLGIGFGAEESK